MISRILATLWTSAVIAFAGGTLDSGTTTYTQTGLAEGSAYQISAGGTWAGATITVAVFNHTLGDYVTVTTLTSTASTKRIRATGQKLRATISGGSGTESLAFEALRLPIESANPTAAEIAAIITEDPASALAPTGPAVWVTFADGTRTPYAPAADTNAARGDALSAAWTAALATTGAETIDLYPATFDCARATSTVISVATQFAVETGMTVRFNGATVTHGASFNGAVIFGADTADGWSIIGPGILQGTAATSSGAAEIGINTRQSRRWLIRDLTVRYFRGVGIQFNGGTYPTTGEYGTYKGSTGKIINCHIDLNNLGLSTGSSSELLDVTGCTFNKNLTACDLYAGATRFTACEIMWNTNHGLRIRNYGNSAHGSFVSGVIAHNFGFGIQMEATNNGFMIADSVIGADTNSSNKIESLGGGMVITGCIVDAPFYASATPSGFNRFENNFLSGTLTVVTDLSSAERMKWIFDNNNTASAIWTNDDTVVYRYADDTAAGTAGLTAGRKYTDSDTNAVTIKQ